jgi:hypothetical protein
MAVIFLNSVQSQRLVCVIGTDRNIKLTVLSFLRSERKKGATNFNVIVANNFVVFFFISYVSCGGTCGPPDVLVYVNT